MDKEVKKLENCLNAIKKCLKIPRVEDCICFSDAFKALALEANELDKKIDRISNPKSRKELISLKEEIEKIKKSISQDNKECLGCSPCIASAVFKAYPDRLNSLYLDNKL